MTSREIIGQILDIEMQLEWSEDEQERTRLQEQLTILQRQLADKVDNIDEFVVELQRRRNLIQAEIDTYTKERKRLYHRRNAVDRTKDYLEKTVLPMIVKTMGTDGTFETDTSRYTLYERYGSLEVLDETRVPDDYKKVVNNKYFSQWCGKDISQSCGKQVSQDDGNPFSQCVRGAH